MIDLETFSWLAAGIVAGSLHNAMLWRATHQISAWTPATGMLRLGVVASVLVLASLAGDIVVAAAGWAVGFVSVGAWFVVMRTNTSVASPSVHSRK